MSSNGHAHITSYKQHGIVLLVLLTLTVITVTVAELKLTPSIAVAVALVIASIKGFVVAKYFMHLKYEKLIFKIMAGMVALLFTLIFIITFLDYGLRDVY